MLEGIDIASYALFDLEVDGVYMKFELSRPEHAGIRHWEFGQNLDVLSFLIETPNPGQNWSSALPDIAVNHGSVSDDEAAADTNTAVNVVTDPKNPLCNRVYEQLAVVRAILANHTLLATPGTGIEFKLPFDLRQLLNSDLGPFLR